MWFVTTHIATWDTGVEILQLIQFLRSLDPMMEKPIVLMGDFNKTPNTEGLHHLNKFMQDTWLNCGQGDGFTWRRLLSPFVFNFYEHTQLFFTLVICSIHHFSDNPEKRIDFVFISKQRNQLNFPKCHRAETIRSTASDHLPLLVVW
jgi:endonuclease/exonuclease/phosphatase family metal-dependent hydrolase